MNQKTTKMIRRIVRARGKDPREGTLLCSQHSPFTGFYHPTESGRGMYRAMKKLITRMGG